MISRREWMAAAALLPAARAGAAAGGARDIVLSSGNGLRATAPWS